ncbi:MAG: class I SAM-dependent methyltransferase [Pseudomonadota bacterium]
MSTTQSTVENEDLSVEIQIDHYVDYLQSLIDKDGPDPEDYEDLDIWITDIYELLKEGRISEEQRVRMLKPFEKTLTLDSMQGFTFLKPHGYAGDFEIIDRIYRRQISDKKHLKKWDTYFHYIDSTDAVRNRLPYLSKSISPFLKDHQGTFEVLNIASGPGRDMLNFFQENPDADIQFDCVEQDLNAIKHAEKLCDPYSDRISFTAKNALRFNTDKQYDLVWSAGLFDYFNDKLFIFMLKRMRHMAKKGGRIIVGNSVSTNNPAHLALFDWHLFHRGLQTLKALGTAAGFQKSQIEVIKEPSGKNAFLHIQL